MGHKARHSGDFYTPQPPEKSLRMPKNQAFAASQIVHKRNIIRAESVLGMHQAVFSSCGDSGTAVSGQGRGPLLETATPRQYD
jgi:hypothetical protein